MKLIIDISDEVYKYIKSLHLRSMLEEYVNDGIPLDKITDEIEASKWTDSKYRYVRNALASGLDKALDIIAKYTKGVEE